MGDLDISSALAQNGATVYIVGRRKEKLEMAVKMHQAVCPPDFRNRLLMEAFERENHPSCR
jgi:NADP-dependent 3-hydroxy acid dehydrogenase YdfG